MKETREKRFFTDEHKRKLCVNNPKSQKIICEMSNGDTVIFDSVRDCERKVGVSRQSILNWMANGISKKGSEIFKSINLVSQM